MKKTASPKKVNVVDMANRMLLAIEFKAKNLQLDIKSWSEPFSAMTAMVEKIEKWIKSKESSASQTLNKEFLDLNDKMTKLNKDIDASQKRFNQGVIDFETKLLIPFTKGEYKNQDNVGIEEARKTIEDIQGIIDLNKKSLDQALDKSIDLTKRLANLESPVNAICLPSQIEEALVINEKLIERLQKIQLASAISGPNSGAQQPDRKQLEEKFLKLSSSHQKSDSLFAGIKKELKIPDGPK